MLGSPSCAPAQAYTARPKATPAKPSIPVHYRIRRDKTDTSGVITIRYDSQLRHIGLGKGGCFALPDEKGPPGLMRKARQV